MGAPAWPFGHEGAREASFYAVWHHLCQKPLHHYSHSKLHARIPVLPQCPTSSPVIASGTRRCFEGRQSNPFCNPKPRSRKSFLSWCESRLANPLLIEACVWIQWSSTKYLNHRIALTFTRQIVAREARAFPRRNLSAREARAWF